MDEILERIETHLGTLEYSVVERDEGVFEASHDRFWRFCFAHQSDGVLFQSFIGVRGDADLRDFFEFINAIERRTILAKMYLEEEGDLAIEAWWAGDYRADAFEQFVDAWNHDIALLSRHPQVEDFLE